MNNVLKPPPRNMIVRSPHVDRLIEKAKAREMAKRVAEKGVDWVMSAATRIGSEFNRAVEEHGGWRKETWRLAARSVIERGGTNLVETGCYRGTAADGASTLILAQLAKLVGGFLDSYELNPENIAICRRALTQRGLSRYVAFHEGDSVRNLSERKEEIHFAYLDSYDCGLGPDYSPCQNHQLAEVEAILPMMARRSTILLDDYVKETGGKTKRTMERLDRLEWERLATEYQVLYATDNAFRYVPHRFCVLTGHGDEYVPLAVRTIYANKAQYCWRHGYDLKVFKDVYPEFNNGKSHAGGYTWSRLKKLLKLLESRAYDWVWVVGCDTLVTNMAVTLESIVDESQSKEAMTRSFPWHHSPSPPLPPPVVKWVKPKGYSDIGKKHVIFCGEAVAPLQADSFLVKGTKEGADYLRDILGMYEKYKTHTWVENQAMIDHIEKHASVIHILPQHRLNAFDYSLFYQYGDIYKQGKDCYGNRGQWKHGDFLIHFPAQTLEKRLALVEKYEPQIVYENHSKEMDGINTQRRDLVGSH